MVTEDILIRIRAIDEATGVLSKVAGSVKQINSSMAGVGAGVSKLTVIKSFKPAAASTTVFSGKLNNLAFTAANAGISVKKFNSILKANNLLFVKGIGIYDLATNKFQDIARVTKMASVQAKRFKFEWLSVMFAGMALSRAFGGLVRTQFQLFGVTDTLAAAWTTVLLPIMEKITPFLFLLLEAFMNLPEPVKLLIGGFVLFAAALGGVLAVVGQVMLAVGGFALLGVTISGIIAFVAAFAAVLIGIIFIVKGIFNIFKGKFEGIGQIIMGVGVILLLFIGWWALIPIAVGAAVFFIIKNWTKVKQFFVRIWNGMKKTFSDAWGFIKAIFFKATIIGIIIKNWDKIAKFFVKTWEFIVDSFVKAGKFIVKAFLFVWESIKLGMKAFINFFIGGINVFISGIEAMVNFAIKGINKLIRLLNKVPGVNIRRIGDVDLGRIPTFQSGGLVDQTGPALVHKGERIIPRSEVNRGVDQSNVFAPTVEITIENMSSNVDIDLLAEEINRRLAPKFEGFAGRGLI